MRIFLMAVVVLSATLVAAQQTDTSAAKPADPCGNANTQMEMNQCSADQFHKAEARLNGMYQKVMGILKKEVTEASQKKDESQASAKRTAIANLRTAEQAWIRYRDAQCEAAKQQYAGGSISPLIYTDCMKDMANERAETLKRTYRMVSGQ